MPPQGALGEETEGVLTRGEGDGGGGRVEGMKVLDPKAGLRWPRGPGAPATAEAEKTREQTPC